MGSPLTLQHLCWASAAQAPRSRKRFLSMQSGCSITAPGFHPYTGWKTFPVWCNTHIYCNKVTSEVFVALSNSTRGSRQNVTVSKSIYNTATQQAQEQTQISVSFKYCLHMGLPETPEEPKQTQRAATNHPEQARALGGHVHQWGCSQPNLKNSFRKCLSHPQRKANIINMLP